MLNRKMLIVAAFLLCVIMLTACGSNDSGKSAGPSNGTGEGTSQTGSSADGSSTDDGEIVELRFGWWGEATRHDKYNKLMDMFEADYPNIKIIREPSTWSDYWDKLATQSAGGNPPDIIMLTLGGRLADYASRGVIMPLDEFIENGVIDLSGFSDTAIELGSYNGSVYMVTKGLSAVANFVNASLLERKGLPMPDYEMSWDEFLDYMREIQPQLGENEQGKQIYPLKDMGGNDVAFEIYLRQHGQNLFTEDGSGFGFDRQYMIDWFTMWQQMKEEQLVPPAEITEEEDLDWEQGMLANHRVVMDWRNGNHLKVLQNHMEDELKLVRLPSNPNGENQHGETVAGAFLAISNYTKHPEAAAQFINYFLNDVEFNQLYNNEHGIIANEDLLNELEMHPADVVTANHLMDVLNSTEAQIDRPQGISSIIDKFSRTYTEINFGVTSIEQGVDEIFAEAERVLR